jgi:hypothetical protein
MTDKPTIETSERRAQRRLKAEVDAFDNDPIAKAQARSLVAEQTRSRRRTSSNDAAAQRVWPENLVTVS